MNKLYNGTEKLYTTVAWTGKTLSNLGENTEQNYHLIQGKVKQTK